MSRTDAKGLEFLGHRLQAVWQLIRCNEVPLSLFVLTTLPTVPPRGTVGGMSKSTATIGQAYNYKVVRQFVIATIVWGVVGMAMGVWIA